MSQFAVAEIVAIVNDEQFTRGFSWDISDVKVDGDTVDVLVSWRKASARLEIAVSDAGHEAHWLYAPPRDAADWANQLRIWIDEEVLTGGLGSTRLRRIRSGGSYVIPDVTGWRRVDSDTAAD